MKITLAVFTLFFVYTLAAPPAEARRGGAKTQELFFVTDTKIQQNGETLSLCHLVTTQSVIFVNFWRSIDSYVFSRQKCEGTEYLTIGDSSIASLQGEGLIPKEVPTEPKLSMNQILIGFWGHGILGTLLIIAFFRFIAIKTRQATRQKAFAFDDPFQKNLMEVLCHAAMADGQVHVYEVELIQETAQDMTERKFSKEQITELIKSCEKHLPDFMMKSWGKGMDLEQKITLLKGAMAVVTADSQLDKKEHKFINSFISSIGIPPEIADQVLSGK